MKLRNKKTGDAVYVDFQIPLSNSDKVLGAYSVTSLKELNEDFEDYMPVEPLIKDEKIRKAVRAWAEAVGGSPVCFYEDTGYEGVGRLKIYREGYPAVFDLGHQLYDLELDSQYTIAELCGEEEECEN